MPIEIRELSIKVNVNENNRPAARQERRGTSQHNREALLEECLEQVSELLKQKKER